MNPVRLEIQAQHVLQLTLMSVSALEYIFQIRSYFAFLALLVEIQDFWFSFTL